MTKRKISGKSALTAMLKVPSLDWESDFESMSPRANYRFGYANDCFTWETPMRVGGKLYTAFVEEGESRGTTDMAALGSHSRETRFVHHSSFGCAAYLVRKGDMEWYMGWGSFWDDFLEDVMEETVNAKESKYFPLFKKVVKKVTGHEMRSESHFSSEDGGGVPW